MRLITTLAAATAVLSLNACESGETDAAEEVPLEMTEAERNQAKRECEISAVLQGGTNEQAVSLCECTIEALAVGRSAQGLEMLDADTANRALNTCAVELGMG